MAHADLNVDGSRGFTAFTRGPSAGKIDDGHSAHAAGTVGAIDNGIGVAANATAIPVKALDRRGSGTTSGVSILSTTMGGGTTTSYSGTSMASPHACAVMMSNGNPNTDGTVSGDPDGDPDAIIHM